MRYIHSLLYNKTVSPLRYGHKSSMGTVWRLFHTKKIVRFYGARPAPGRIVLFFCHFLDIIRCPVKFSYYLKFHGACTAFCRVIEGTMTSAGHRLHTWDGHRTILVWNSNRTMCEKSKELSKISIQIGWCPSGHRPMFYESNCHRWEATGIYRSTY